jgi:uncharacterized membrane protein
MKKFSRYAAAALFLGTGFLHLVRPAPFAAIVPPYIPQHFAVVYISGIAELAGGIGLLMRRTRRLAAWCLALLLVAVFPANVYMAINHVQITAKPTPDYVLWGRLFLQPLLIWWILSLRPGKK